MKKRIVSLATVAVATAAAGALLTGLASTPAFAAGGPPWEPDANSVGGLVFYNSSGQQITGGSIADSPIAAYVEGSAVPHAGDTKATLYGFTPVNGQLPTQWSGEPLGASTTYPNSAAPAPLNTATLPVETGASGDESVSAYASDFPNTDTSTTDGYAGLYQLRLYTSGTSGGSAKYDSADVQVTGSTWTVVYPAPTLTPTTTTLTSVPTSAAGAQVGTSVQLNAVVSPSAPGTVQFENGSTNIGSPVTVAAGAASITTSTLPVGTDTLHAVFTPAAGAAYSGSTGTESFTVTAAPAAGTATALAVNPTLSAAFTAVTLTATVTKTSDSSALGSGTGSVKFFDNGTTSLGTASVGSGGVATLSYSNFATGTHSITAQFLPADTSVYSASNSSAVIYTATPPTTTPASQTVDVNIPAGTLTITSPYDSAHPFDLGTAVLDPNEGEFTASAPFGNAANPANGVTVTDTRAGDQPWTASATVTDFADGSSDVINGENLSFTGVTPAYLTGNALQAGDVVTHDVTSSPGGTPYGPTDPGTDGLKGGPHAFATAAHGDGEVNIDGVLTLNAPTSTPAGSYTATLTFTIA